MHLRYYTSRRRRAPCSHSSGTCSSLGAKPDLPSHAATVSSRGGAACSHHALSILHPRLHGKSTGRKTTSPKPTQLPSKELLSGSTSFSQYGPSDPSLRWGQEEQEGKPPRTLRLAGCNVGSHPRDVRSPPSSQRWPREAGEQGPAGRAVPAHDEWHRQAAGWRVPVLLKTY